MERRLGRYRLVREVARGGSGAVFQAEDPQGRQVALKLLLAGTKASPLQRRRFATEVHSLLRLRHPHVVALLDAGESEGSPFLVMEWVEGESLAARLDRDGPLAPRVAAALVRDLAGAIHHAHQQGVLHRDLKPGNVLVRSADGAGLVTDFGLASDLHDEGHLSGSGSSVLARSLRGVWLGTPGWWPPEQAMGDLERIGPPSDVYGLGAVLFSALTAAPPQEGSSAAELLAALDQEPPPPSQLEPGVPASLDAICLRALARDPARRQRDAAALAAELDAFVTPRADRGGVTVRLRPVHALALAGSLLVLLGSALLALRPARAPHPQESSLRQALLEAQLLVAGGDPRGDPALEALLTAEDRHVAAEARLALARARRARDPTGALRLLQEGELEPRLRVPEEEAVRLILQVGEAQPQDVAGLLAQPGAAELLPELRLHLRDLVAQALEREPRLLVRRLAVLGELSPSRPAVDPLADQVLARLTRVSRGDAYDLALVAAALEALCAAGLRPGEQSDLNLLLERACLSSASGVGAGPPLRDYARVLAAALRLDAELLTAYMPPLGSQSQEYPPDWSGSFLVALAQTGDSLRLAPGLDKARARHELLRRLREGDDPLGPRGRAHALLRCIVSNMSPQEALELAQEAASLDSTSPFVQGQLALTLEAGGREAEAVALMTRALEWVTPHCAQRTAIFREDVAFLLAGAAGLFRRQGRAALAHTWIERLQAQGVSVERALERLRGAGREERR